MCLPLTETQTCPDLANCPINGEWSAWSKSVDCDKLCGEGVEVHTRLCEGQLYGGEPCEGEAEKRVPCNLRDCFCSLNEWSDWSGCIAKENGCGHGSRSRERTKKDSDIECSLRDGDELEEVNDCFTKHCTDEFYKLNKVTIQVLEGQYPGTSKDWEITIKDHEGKDFCTTSAISGLDKDVKRSITGANLGQCGTGQKKLAIEDFQSWPSLQVHIKPKKQLNDMAVTNVDIYNCNYYWGGSDDTWQIELQGKCRFAPQSGFVLGQWKKLNSERQLGECFTKRKRYWPKTLQLDFQSDGSNDMAICKVEIETKGNFRSARYFHEESAARYVWTQDGYGHGEKNSELTWGPLQKENESENKMKIGSVQLDFCVSNCDNGLAEYKSRNISEEFFLMKDGLEITLDLQDKCESQFPKSKNVSNFVDHSWDPFDSVIEY